MTMIPHCEEFGPHEAGAVPLPGLARRTVLFLCTGNSARSILAESLLNHLARGRYRALSAGSHPNGSVNPHALALLGARGLPVAGLRSKSWEEFSGPRAPAIDIVITVCDQAARAACPVWTGSPARGHWGIADPAATSGSPAEIGAAFELAYARLARRVGAFLELPVDKMEAAALQTRLNEIGARADLG